MQGANEEEKKRLSCYNRNIFPLIKKTTKKKLITMEAQPLKENKATYNYKQTT